MPLSTGTLLGPYQIVAPIGAGGMGEVYKAHDTRLERFVALKILPQQKLADADRKRRFVQEAKAASALNHPSIVTIYDIGSENGVDFIAMEFVQGKTLDQSIPRSGMRINEVLRYATQAADALAKAHAAGIIHRDLKPGNIMVTTDGLVKVLDFGLAKLTQPAGTEDSVTRTMQAYTDDGAILGTASYMSPEQAEGRPVDARSDIFSFGAVLYEMVTGQRAFRGDTQMSTLSAILRDDPKPAGQLREDLPPELSRIVTRCLRKDPARRFQNMADLKVALEELKEESESGSLAPAAASPARRGRPRAPVWTALAAVAALAGAAGWYLARKAPAPEPPMAPIPLTSYQGLESGPSFSPDGNQVAFVWNGEKQDNLDIYVKLIGPGAPLRLTTDPSADFSPKWSPDGRSIAFARRLPDGNIELMLVPALGGPERKLTPLGYAFANSSPSLLCWSPDGKWLVAASFSAPPETPGLFVVSVETGETRRLTSAPPNYIGDSEPAISPDGRTLAFTREAGLNLIDLMALPLSANLTAAGEPRKLPTPDRLVSHPAWTNDSLELLFTSGDRTNSNLYRMAVSGSEPPQSLASLGTWISHPALSAQGRRLAYAHGFQDANIWRIALDGKPASPEKFIASSFREVFPQFSPDGKRIVFYSNRTGTVQIWVCDADGSRAAPLTSLSGSITGTPRWSPDGQQISFDSNTGGSWQIYTVSAEGGKPRPITSGSTSSVVASWSRDGRWIYFTSNRSGDFQVWKAPSAGGAAVQVTRNGGHASLESPDGKTLYFTRNDGAAGIWKMPVEGGPEAQVVKAIHRFNYAVTEQGIYFTPPRGPDGSSSIQFLNLATGAVTTIAKIGKPDVGLAVAPDGRSLLYAQIDYEGSDLMLVENFR